MNEKKIITVTLNPWLDRTLTTHYLAMGYKNRTQGETRLDPSGRGVNIARAAHQLGVETHALVLLGNDAIGRAYESLLEMEGFPYTIVWTEAGTSSNTIIFDIGHHQETQLIQDRGEVAAAELAQVLERLPALIQPDDYVVLAGSLSLNMASNIYWQLAEVAQAAGAKVVVAGGGEAFGQALAAQPEVVVLSQQEAESYFNCPVRSLEDVVSVGTQLQRQTNGRVLIEMRERKDELLVTASGRWLVGLPEKNGGTSSGIWDALLAGYLAGRLAERPFVEALEMGATAAGYTATQLGNEFGSVELIEELAEDINVKAVERQSILQSKKE